MIEIKASKPQTASPPSAEQIYRAPEPETKRSRWPVAILLAVTAVAAYVMSLFPSQSKSDLGSPTGKPEANEAGGGPAPERAAEAEAEDETGSLPDPGDETALGSGEPGPAVGGIADFLGIDSPPIDYEQLPLPRFVPGRIEFGLDRVSNDNGFGLTQQVGGLSGGGSPAGSGLRGGQPSGRVDDDTSTPAPRPFTPVVVAPFEPVIVTPTGPGPVDAGPGGEEPGPGGPGDEDPDDEEARNHAPVLRGAVVLANIGVCQTVLITVAALLAGAFDADGDTLAVVDLQVSGGSLEATEGGWLFTPAQGGYGPVQLSYAVSDGTVAVAQSAGFSVVEFTEIIGTPGDDTLIGTECADFIDGRDGHDTIDARGGADIIHGGAGNDIIRAAAGHDLVYAGRGDDIVHGGDGNDTIYGGAGHDRLFGEAGDDIIHGEAGNDLILGGAGHDQLSGGEGDDTIHGEAGNDMIAGGEGCDLATGGSGADMIDGGAGDDTLSGDDGDDHIIGADGDDMIAGGEGCDILDGGEGCDTIDGGAGADLIFGGAGNDTILAQAGADLVFGGTGDDHIVGADGNDILEGGDGADLIEAGTGDDTVAGGAGADIVLAGEGDDTVSGDADADSLFGQAGADRLDGGAGNDLVDGGSGADCLLGGDGDDVLLDGAGADTVQGGAGDDRIVAARDGDADHYDGGAGHDTLDLSATSQGVRVDLTSGTAAGAEIGCDMATNIEAVIGGSGDDHFTVGTSATALTGGGGDDSFAFEVSFDDDERDLIHQILDLDAGDRIIVKQYQIGAGAFDADGAPQAPGADDPFGAAYGDTGDDERPFRFRIEKIGDNDHTFVDVYLEQDGERDFSIEVLGAHKFYYL